MYWIPSTHIQGKSAPGLESCPCLRDTQWWQQSTLSPCHQVPCTWKPPSDCMRQALINFSQFIEEKCEAPKWVNSSTVNQWVSGTGRTWTGIWTWKHKPSQCCPLVVGITILTGRQMERKNEELVQGWKKLAQSFHPAQSTITTLKQVFRAPQFSSLENLTSLRTLTYIFLKHRDSVDLTNSKVLKR